MREQEANRCPKCGSHAAVNEVALGRYTCVMCGGPRELGEGTVLASTLSDSFARRARQARIAKWLFRFVGAGSLLIGCVVTGLLAWLVSGTAAAITGLAFAGVAFSALLLSRRVSGDAERYALSARDQRLLSEAKRQAGAMTAEDAARMLSIGEPEADQALTDLAKQGKVELDVDDEGIIRYRVAELDEALEQSEPASSLRRRR